MSSFDSKLVVLPFVVFKASYVILSLVWCTESHSTCSSVFTQIHPGRH